MIARKKLFLEFCYSPELNSEGEFFLYNLKSGKSSEETHSCREAFEYYLKDSTRWIGFFYKKLK
jgi:hypothetical protein